MLLRRAVQATSVPLRRAPQRCMATEAVWSLGRLNHIAIAVPDLGAWR